MSKASIMKVIAYCLWGLSSVIILLAISFNHYAEFYLNDFYANLLFNVYNKEWAYLNVMITGIWLILTWIGLHLYLKEDGQ